MLADATCPKIAFITGITGQDGSYLTELLLDKGYFVYGMIRRSSSFNLGRLQHIRDHNRLVCRLLYYSLPMASESRVPWPNNVTARDIDLSPSFRACQVLKYGDITDSCNIGALLDCIRLAHPELESLEVYHLCAQSHVHVSFQLPEYTGNTDALGTLKLLECMRSSGTYVC